jgi:hypothetical protein
MYLREREFEMSKYMIMRLYREWLIERQPHSGMYCASNYSAGFSMLRADTLAGIKRAIRMAIAERNSI